MIQAAVLIFSLDGRPPVFFIHQNHLRSAGSSLYVG